MRRVALGGIGVVVLAVFAASCFDTNLDLRAGGTTSPTPTPGGAFDSGDGADGDINAGGFVTVVNTCHVLVSASNQFLTADSTSGIRAGRRVVVLQVQDTITAAIADQTPLTNIGAAGMWEIRRVAAVADGTHATFTSNLTGVFHTDVAGRSAEVCTMPEFQHVTISPNRRVGPNSWDGMTGGLVAFYAQTLTVSTTGGVSANTRGFRGGQLAALASGSHVTSTDLPLTDGNGGGKGEGLVFTSWTRAARGNVANGAGGGNADAAGGGGGGGSGAGGTGSSEYVNVAGGVNTSTRGMGGARITTPSSPRLLFGGGGGAAHRPSGTQGSGGEGGGAVLIVVGALEGSGEVRANAGDGENSTSSGGGGGGGAGGTLLVVVSNATAWTGSLLVHGGSGGDTSTNDGPGAGGGGGFVYSTAMPGVFVETSGGTPGLESATTGTSRDATNGAAGVLVPVTGL